MVDVRRAFDPDFGKTGFALHLFRLRFRRLKLSQRAFAAKFGLGYSTVRDAEQGARPSPALRLVVAAIARDPVGMVVTAKIAGWPCSCAEIACGDCCIDSGNTARR